jgi:hypothetical protein
LASTATPAGTFWVTWRRRISGVFPMLDSSESPATESFSSSNWALTIVELSRFWSALTCQRFSRSRPVAIPSVKYKTGRDSLAGFATGF